MLTKIKEMCCNIATLWQVGYWPFGYLLAGLCAVPIASIFKFLHSMNNTYYYIFVGVCAVLLVIAVQVALSLESDIHTHVFVVNNVVGMLIALMQVPLTLKFIVIGYFLFYSLKYLIPLLYENFLGYNLYYLPVLARLIFYDILAGALVNLFLRFVWWMAH